LAATEIASELGLSATPVREALSRLAGEGLLEDRRGEGFFVRRLSRADIVALYRLSLTHLSLAIEAQDADAPGALADTDLDPDADPVEATERLFAAWAAASGSRALSLSYSRLQGQLGAARRLEGRLLEDLRDEVAGLLEPETDRPVRLARVRAFYARRVLVAGRLADLLDQAANGRPL
jgi:DNA-binding transcriptional MocR family regulator